MVKRLNFNFINIVFHIYYKSNFLFSMNTKIFLSTLHPFPIVYIYEIPEHEEVASCPDKFMELEKSQ